MGVQAAASNNLRALTPQPTKSIQPTNYLGTYDYTNQYDPELHEELLMSKARNSMTGLLDLMGMKESFSADKYYWSEEGELHDIFSAVTRAGNVFTVTAHTFSKYDKIKIQDVANDISELGLVTVLTDADTVTIVPTSGAAYNASLGTTALSLWKVGSEFPKGSDGPETSMAESLTIYDNKPIIEKRVYTCNGSDHTNISWLKTEAGWFWTDYEAERTKDRFDDELEVSCLVSEKTNAASPAAALNLNGAEGLFPALKDRGNVFDGIITDESDWTAVVKRLDLVHGENANYLFCDRDQDTAINQYLGSINAHDTSAANYGIFPNGEAMALNLNFRGFNVSGYDFFKQTLSVLINPLKLGNVNNADSDTVRFITMPNGATKVKRGDYANIDDSQGAKDVPYVTLMFKGRPGYDRFYQEMVTGTVDLATPTSRSDTRTIDMLTERSLRVAGAENMWIGIGTA